jgi:hypothetical protein
MRAHDALRHAGWIGEGQEKVRQKAALTANIRRLGKPRGSIRLTPTSRYIRDKLFPKRG